MFALQILWLFCYVQKNLSFVLVNLGLASKIPFNIYCVILVCKTMVTNSSSRWSLLSNMLEKNRYFCERICHYRTSYLAACWKYP